jgi:propionyl-CoA carboxylase alpha chain/3-methylcrotonyl-CoA carboxylase alpha subunit
MIAKLIAHAPSRGEAAAALAAACQEVEVWPVKTNAAFLARCLLHPDFVRGDLDTGFIDRRSEALVARVEPGPRAVAAAAIALAESAAQEHAGFDGDPYSPWSPGPGPAQGFRLNAHPRASIRMELDGRSVDAAIAGAAGLEADAAWSVGAGDDALVGEPVEDQVWFWDGGAVTALPHPEGVVVFEGGDAFLFERPDYELHHEAEAGSGAVLAPMPGRIVAVHVAAGDAVEKGAKLVTLEAMKMEHGLTAPFAGKVAEVSAQAGGQVSEGTLLVRLEAPST